MLKEQIRQLRLRRTHRRILRALDDERSDDLRAIREQVTLAFVEELDVDVRRAAACAEREVGPMSDDPEWLRALLRHMESDGEGRGAG